jgi:hypothetical protein
MKKIYTLTICLLCNLVLNANVQNIKEKTMVENEIFSGKIKSVYTTNGIDFIKMYFNPRGMLIKKECQFVGQILEIYDNYIYDNKNKLISYNLYFDQDTVKYTCKYNSRGLLTKVIMSDTFDETEIFKYKYNQKGNCIEKYTNNFYTTKKIYNSKNQIIEEWECRKDTIRAFGEDENGMHFEEYDISNFEGMHRLYEYNEFGNVSLRTIKNESCRDMITYIYDEKGNWISRNSSDFECFVFRDTGTDVESIDGEHCTRIIEYYE